MASVGISKRESLLARLLNNPGLLISLIILVGFMLAPNEHANIQAISAGQAGLFGGGKTIRLITVILAGALAGSVLVMRGSRGIGALLGGGTALLLIYALLGEATVVFSPLRSLTIFKASEMILVCMIIAIVLTSSDRARRVNDYIKGIFWVYTLFVVSALIETAVGGTGGHKQLVGATPFLTTMMHSSYPPMVGNALGYLGALVALFGLYLFDSKDIAGIKGRLLSLVIFSLGSTVLVLSYTRSVLLFFVLCVGLLLLLNRQHVRFGLLCCLLVGALLVPSVQDRLTDHMRRGMSDEQISTLSGRTTFWAEIFDRSTIKVMVGQGFGSASKLSGESAHLSRVGNAHNSLAEIIMSSGILGAMIWLALLVRIAYRLLTGRRRMKLPRNSSPARFHSFLIAVFVLSTLRTLMNSTFVYLDVFTFVLVSLILYTEVFCGQKRVALSQATGFARKPGLLHT